MSRRPSAAARPSTRSPPRSPSAYRHSAPTLARPRCSPSSSPPPGTASPRNLRRRGLLEGALWDGLLADRDQRLARLAVEQVEPAGLAGLADPVRAVVVEEHDGARRVVVPDVVVDLLEVPAVLAGLRVDRDDR